MVAVLSGPQKMCFGAETGNQMLAPVSSGFCCMKAGFSGSESYRRVSAMTGTTLKIVTSTAMVLPRRRHKKVAHDVMTQKIGICYVPF